MRRFVTLVITCVWVLGVAATPSGAEPSKDVVTEILGILRDRGLVDDQEYQRLTREYAASQQSFEDRLPKLSFFGDLRARHESFWFQEDELGTEKDNRYRTRYRLRLGAKARVNDRATVVVRIAGGGDRRSTNQTLGDGSDDGFFDPDDLFIDRAYVKLTPFEGEPFPGGSLVIEAGRVPNPFVGKVGKDFMLFDGDIVLEGATLRLGAQQGDATRLYANGGYYVMEENSSAKDPHMAAAQLGIESRLSDTLFAGLRASGFFFDSLNGSVNSMGVFCPSSSDPTTTDFRDASGESFMCRAAAGGNILAGLTGDPLGGDMTTGELRGHLVWNGSEDWPVVVYATMAKNFDAEGVPGAGDEDTAFGFGIEVGDKTRLVKLGMGYFHIEANAFPALFVDSDLFDEKTNRKGFVFYGARRIWKNTDFALTLFRSDEIEDGPVFVESVADAERYRLQTDLIFSF